jgi:hypothetical protein
MKKALSEIWVRRLAIALILLGVTFFFIQMPVSSAAMTRLVLLNTQDKSALPSNIRILENYNSFVLAEVPASDLENLQQRYLIDLLPERTRINLPNVSFDSMGDTPQLSPSLQSAPDDPYFLVQFYGPTKQEWLDELTKLDVTFLGYHPSFTFIVRMDPALVPQVEAAHAVQWVGRYHPGYRLAPESEMLIANKRDSLVELNIIAFPDVAVEEFSQNVLATGVSIESLSEQNPTQVTVWAAPAQFESLAHIQGVYSIEPFVLPTFDNERGVAVTHTWDVWKASRNSLLQDLMGAGQIAGMVDSGLDDNDTTPLINDFYDFTSGVQTSRIQAAVAGSGCGGGCICAGQDDGIGHGTHVAGSIIGNGYNSLLQLGLQAQARGADPFFDYAFGVGQAPEAKIAFAYVSPSHSSSLCGIGNEYTTWLSLYNQGARNVNNSWGSSGAVTYGGSATSADNIMWNYQDYLVITSASNDGPNWNTVSQPGTAKNNLSVGAAGNHRSVWISSSDTASSLTDFSGRGPVNPTGGDGRTKPDIIATGADVLSTRTTFIPNTTVTLWANESGDGDSDGHLDYWWSGGTSMSSPHITGAATIVRDYLQDIKGFLNTQPPSAALVKALLVNGAVDMGYGYESLASAPYGGRNMQGWGMANVEQSILPHAPRSFVFDDFTSITDNLKQSTRGMDSSGDYVEYTAVVADSSEPLKITLTWTDRQTGSDSYAVNNLDLVVTSPGSVQYRGNVFAGSWSTTGGSADTRNNTEAVYIQNPATGTWTIRVTATTINSSIQPYAIVISGGLGVNPGYTRTCSGTTDCLGRISTSALAYYPTIKPLNGTQEHTHPGTTVITNIRLTNWGLNSDTISLSATAADMNGNNAPGFNVTFSPAGPYSLASGASQDVQVVVMVDNGVTSDPYDITLSATGTGGRQMAQVIGLNVIPITSLLNEKQIVSTSGPQYLAGFWGNGQNLWIAYVTGEGHNNSEADIRTRCSTDGGQTWTDTGQVNAVDELYYFAPAIGGKADGSRVTVLWSRADGVGMYARTWTRTSGCAGSWGSIITMSALASGSYIADPAVIYDNQGDILTAWLEYTNSTSKAGIVYRLSTDGGVSWTTKAWVPDANSTGSTHRWPAFTLDTRNNDIWMTYSYRNTSPTTLNRDIRLKRWDGDTNAWVSGYINVANTTDREAHSGIAYIQGATAAQDSLWVGWQQYPSDWTTSTARVYYARSSGTLPGVTFPTKYGPYSTRSSEGVSPAIVGNNSFAYISYLAYNDSFRGANPYIMRVPIGGGAPDSTYQVSATVDDPTYKARGNAGMARLLWLNTTINGNTFNGPTLLYSKNSPAVQNPTYDSGLGTSQTMFNIEENFDLFLAQALPAKIPFTYADSDGLCEGNTPCFPSFQQAINAVDSGGQVTVYPKTFNENVTLNKAATVNLLGNTNINDLTISSGVFNAPVGTLSLNGNLTFNGGVFNNGNGSIAMAGSSAQTIGGATSLVFYNLAINNAAGVNLSQTATVQNTLTLSNGAFSNSGGLTLADGAAIDRSAGSLSTAPGFGATVHVTYNGTTGVTSGPELPSNPTVLVNLTINNSGGVILNQDQTVNGTLTLQNGLLTLGSHHLTLGSSAFFNGSLSASAMIVPTGSGELRKVIDTADPAPMTFPIGDNTGTAEYSPATIDCAGVAGSGYIALTLVDGLHPNAGPTPRLTRYWTVSQSGLTAYACALTFYYVEDDLDVGASTEDQIYSSRYNGSNWLIYNPVDPAANTFSMTVTSLSDFTGSALTPSGTTLAKLQAVAKETYIEINWETIQEVDNDGFNIYRSTSPDVIPSPPINGSLIASLGGGGGAYAFQDNTAEKGVTYYYWIEFVEPSSTALFDNPVFATIYWKIFMPILMRN